MGRHVVFTHPICRACHRHHTARDSDGEPGVCSRCRSRSTGLPRWAWKLTPMACLKCKKGFCKTARNQVYCSPDCRPSKHSITHGQAETFHIDGMTPAEYAFMRIMADRGIRLTFIGRNGKRFFLNGTHYRPDFQQDPHTYIEVCGTRQAYHANKAKWALFRTHYPMLSLKVVRPDGTEI